MAAKKVTKEYVNNAEFLQLLIDYKARKEIRVHNKLGVIFLKISHGMMNRPNFINYSHDRKCDMISDSTYFMSKYLDRYDTDKKNPFAYFSQICFNAFLQSINKQTKISNNFVSISYIENLDRDGNGESSEYQE